MKSLKDLTEKQKAHLLAKQLTVGQFIADAMEDGEAKQNIIKFLNSCMVYCQRIELRAERNEENEDEIYSLKTIKEWLEKESEKEDEDVVLEFANKLKKQLQDGELNKFEVR